jgi:hypothetical protein
VPGSSWRPTPLTSSATTLSPRAIYLWHVHEGSCADTGAPVAGWTYRTQLGANGTLTSNASDNANTKGTSATFNAGPTKSYSVPSSPVQEDARGAQRRRNGSTLRFLAASP